MSKFKIGQKVRIVSTFNSFAGSATTEYENKVLNKTFIIDHIRPGANTNWYHLEGEDSYVWASNKDLRLVFDNDIPT